MVRCFLTTFDNPYNPYEQFEQWYVYKFSLDASKSNAIYGRSATVQPAAYYVHIWRRVA